MLLESIILAACMEGKGCSESTEAYVKSDKELAQVLVNIEEYKNRILNRNQFMVYVFTPVYAVVSGKPASFKVYNNTVLEIDVKNSATALKWSW